VLNVKDVKIIFGHLLNCMHSHIELAEPNLFLDAFDISSWHLLNLLSHVT
jgi:hypothetical protein